MSASECGAQSPGGLRLGDWLNAFLSGFHGVLRHLAVELIAELPE